LAPSLKITDPIDGAVVANKVYTFRGVTDPDCTVDVDGKYYADVDSNGNWTLNLTLHRGNNATTFVATDLRGRTTKILLRVTHLPELTLRAGGLGPFDFGDPVDDVAKGLISLLGPPTHDELVVGTGDDIFSGLVPGYDGDYHVVGPDTTYARRIRWQRLGLSIQFTDHTPLRDDDLPHLVRWSYTGTQQGLTTNEGIGLGATVNQMASVFRDRLHLPDEEDPIAGGWYWSASDEPPVFIAGWDSDWRIHGGLSADPSDPSATVTWLFAGFYDLC
jgi:hypothetical protein